MLNVSISEMIKAKTKMHRTTFIDISQWMITLQKLHLMNLTYFFKFKSFEIFYKFITELEHSIDNRIPVLTTQLCIDSRMHECIDIILETYSRNLTPSHDLQLDQFPMVEHSLLKWFPMTKHRLLNFPAGKGWSVVCLNGFRWQSIDCSTFLQWRVEALSA